ncbi:Cornichon domain-containing protein [Rozella allomycis CSF55]|uniref:Cornichon domain-containing protein n=1 Tax=Rozella allomycis (strain CSF55) TaxID=988480 RepID=A0A075AQZ8_ROZAC|nr:Cornichon domain-containing protein [Rozella allomycis CSF55]|eukprot:EPZ32653.1 Cornichon domain-containing protein [Rozella allomycis CSF55]
MILKVALSFEETQYSVNSNTNILKRHIPSPIARPDSCKTKTMERQMKNSCLKISLRDEEKSEECDKREKGKIPDSIDLDLLEDVPAWLRSLRLHKYSPIFEKMNWKSMIYLTDEQLEAMGVSALGARRKMLKGSGIIKSGFSGDNQPKSVIPAIVGRTKYKQVMTGSNIPNNENFIGNKAMEYRGLLKYASGRTTGVVVDIGDGVSHVVPIYEGYTIPQAIQRADIAGSGYPFFTSSEFEVVRTIKEKYCYVSNSPSKDSSNNQELYYSLPDGNVIKLNTERHLAPEILFTPELIGNECPPRSLREYSPVRWNNLNERSQGKIHIIVGFPERLLSEIEKEFPRKDVKVRIFAPPERKYSSWIGGSILSSLSTFKKLWVIMYSDLECDYMNPIDLCNKLNPYIIPEILAHGTLTIILFIGFYWVPVLWNIPLLAYHIYW